MKTKKKKHETFLHRIIPDHLLSNPPSFAPPSPVLLSFSLSLTPSLNSCLFVSTPLAISTGPPTLPVATRPLLPCLLALKKKKNTFSYLFLLFFSFFLPHSFSFLFSSSLFLTFPLFPSLLSSISVSSFFFLLL